MKKHVHEGLSPQPLRLVTRLIGSRGRVNIPLLTAIIAVAALQILAVFLSAFADSTLSLAGLGRGLLQNYGAWAILISDPLILIGAGWVYWHFRRTFLTLPICLDRGARHKYRVFLRPFLDIAAGRGVARLWYALFVLIGFMSWLTNIMQSMEPFVYFSGDVFDSVAHQYGFAAFRVSLFVSWVIVYPIAGYVLLGTSVSSYLLLSKLTMAQMLCPREIGRAHV